VRKQNKTVLDILSIMEKSGILSNVLIIGSWCLSFYEAYFQGIDYHPIIKTRDIDFLLPHKPVFSQDVDIEKILKPLGFEVSFFGKGFMKLESDELILEFLIPEVGRPTDKPVPLKALKFNAQPLRHLSMLWRKPIAISLSGITCQLPHPADYCLQKLITATNRKSHDKQAKDRQAAEYLIQALIEAGDLKEIHTAYNNLTIKQKKYVNKELSKIDQGDLLSQIG
jgi:hypothetical protein